MFDCQVCLACAADADAAGSGTPPLLDLTTYYSENPQESDITALLLLIPNEPGAARDARLRATDGEGVTAIHQSTGNAAVLQHVLSLLGPDMQDLIHATDDDGWEPLHWACLHQNADCVKLLIAAGAHLR